MRHRLTKLCWHWSLVSVLSAFAGAASLLPAQSAITGTVREEGTGAPVADAELTITALRRSTRAAQDGRYALRDLPSGRHRLEVRRLGYSADTVTVQLVNGMTLERDVVLRPAPARLEGVVAKGQFQIPDFEEHVRIGLGQFLTREQLARVEGRRLSEVLEPLRGLDVARGSNRAAWVTRGRGPTSLQNMAAICPEPEGATWLDRRIVERCLCYAHVYLDGMLIGGGRTPAPDINQFMAQQIEAIEYYSGPATTPAKYSKLDSQCGVLVIHTRRSP